MILNQLASFACDESGATALEYGLIAALISVAGISALQSLGSSLDDIFGTASSTLDEAAEG